MTAGSYRAALRKHLGFQLSIHKSGIDHEHAGDGVWLQGAAEMGQVVAVHPGVVYSQAFHMCARLFCVLCVPVHSWILPGRAPRRPVRQEALYTGT